MALSPTAAGFISGYGVAGVLALLMAAYALVSHGDAAEGRVIALLAGALSVWVLAALGRSLVTDPGLRLGLTTVAHLGLTTVPVWVLLFAVLYVDGEWLINRRRVAVLLVVPVLAVVGVATTDTWGLFYRSMAPRPVDGLWLMATVPGPGARSFAVYGYGLFGLATAILAYGMVARSVFYRVQSVIVLGGAAIPWAVEAARLTAGWPHPAIDPRPPALVAGTALFAIGALGSKFVDVVPTGRTLALDALDDAIFLLDRDRRIVGVNDAARRLVTPRAAVGTPIDEVLPAVFSLRHQAPDEEGRVRALERAGETRFYRQRLLPLPDDQGSVIVLTDVTEGRRIRHRFQERSRFLRRQNQRLEEFASVVSHDLRNPLNVASGNLDLLRDECDSDRLDDVEAAHDRMAALIEGLLALARQGQTVGQTEAVSLSEAAERAWAGVPTDGASLDLAEPLGAVQADTDRLEGLLENLFKNAVDHAGTEVTVRVRSTDQGFSVEDDGPGIPPENRDAVFEHGYTTTQEGTGFGLSIVKSIVEAHDWEIEVGEAQGGGALFEVTTVRTTGELGDGLE